MNAENEIDVIAVRNETFLRDLKYYEEAESTNSIAVDLAKTDCETPCLIVAKRQTAGRGRNSNAWWSGDGALTFTLLLDLPVRDVADIGPFSLTVGLAVCQSLERLAPAADLALKWPNDVYFNEKKICGILIERPVASEPRLAIGIGVNVNNSLANAPEELKATATSLVDELELEQPLTIVLIDIIRQLEELTRNHLHSRDALLDQWRAYCLLTGREVTIEQQGRELRGTCRGISESGALLVETGGEVHECIAGTVLGF